MNLKRLQLQTQPAVPEIQGMLVVGATRRAGLPQVESLSSGPEGIRIRLANGATWLVCHGAYCEVDEPPVEAPSVKASKVR